MKRLPYIDGLKGYMAICLFWAHFNICLDTGFALPFTGLTVFSFLCLSGFSLSLSLTQKSQEQINRTIAGRYFRLALPIAVAATVSYALYLLGIYQHVQNPIHFKDYIKMCVMGPLGYAGLNGPVWMIKYFFVGTYLVIILHYLTKDLTLKKSMLVLATVSAFALYISRFYSAIVIGMMVQKVYSHICSNKSNFKIPWYVAIPLLLFAFFMSQIHDKTDNNALSEAMKFVGGIPLVVATLFSVPVQKVLSSKPFAFLGKMYYEVFLLHIPIICTFTLWFSSSKWGSMVWLNLILSLALVMIVSFAMAKFISPVLRSIERRIVDIILK